MGKPRHRAAVRSHWWVRMATRSMVDDSKQRLGGLARARKLTAEQRSEIARNAAVKRWKGSGMAITNLKPDQVYATGVNPTHTEQKIAAYQAAQAQSQSAWETDRARAAKNAAAAMADVFPDRSRDEQELRKWAVQMVFQRSQSQAQIISDADDLFRYVQTGMVSKPE